MSVIKEFQSMVEVSSVVELRSVDVDDEVKVTKDKYVFRCVPDEDSGVLSVYEITGFPEVDSLGLDLSVEEAVEKMEEY